MSGHSKWSTIKRKKALVDAKRSKVWTKVIKEIQVAARIGGGDPGGNPRLRLALDKARAANMTKDAIKRAIEKGLGGSGNENYEDVVYEGYGPAGVAVVVECMTDNRNRTVGEVRHGFEKFGGHLGSTGSVSWLFKKRGIIHVLKVAAGEDQIMEVVIEAGADDVRDEEEVWTVDCDPHQYMTVQDALAKAEIPVENAEVDNIPETRVALDGDRAETMYRLIGYLEDLDDVQNVYANFEVSEADEARLGG
ncbi:MAG TPA: YebC/PmpR family DNA-binding transcriptional regulator [Kofleriaceae bacterium]|nr:YebC/PmpR family DNA-binding transcriptional regulator [Kofleriaceae bacterium]